MKDFKKFIIRGGVFLFLVLFSMYVAIVNLPCSRLSCQHVQMFKFRHELLKTVDSPKIVLIGGSNVAISVDSEFMQYETGYSVVNMGISVAYGLRFRLNDLFNAREYLKEGDIVVFLLEVALFENKFDGKLDRIYPTVFGGYFEGIRNLDFPEDYSVKEFFGVLSSFGSKYFMKTQSPVLSLNSYGDRIVTIRRVWEDSLCYIDDIFMFNEESSKIGYDLLSDFQAVMGDSGVQVLFGFPVIEKSYYINNEEEIEKLYLNLDDYAFKVVGSPERYALEADLFYDTIYHTNVKGRGVRTDRLIEDLIPFLNAEVLGEQALMNEEIAFKDSNILDSNIPEVLQVGEEFPFEITFENTGFSRWTYLEYYRLGVLGDDFKMFLNTTGTLRIDFPENLIIESGEVYTFEGVLVAPLEPGVYTLQLQMLQETVMWFGDIFSREITVVEEYL